MSSNARFQPRLLFCNSSFICLDSYFCCNISTALAGSGSVIVSPAPEPSPEPEPEPELSQLVGLDLNEEFLQGLGGDDAFADCFLSEEEMLNDPQAALVLQRLIEQQAAAAGLDPSAITLQGIATDGDPTPGCQDTGRRRMSVDAVPKFSSNIAVFCELDYRCSVHLAGHLL